MDPTLEQLHIVHARAKSLHGAGEWKNEKLAVDAFGTWLCELENLQAHPEKVVALANKALADRAEVAQEIVQMLEISTSHVSKATAELLDLEVALLKEGSPPETTISVEDHRGFGWWFYIQHDDVEAYEAGLPADLRAAVAYARKLGCSWLLLDQAAPAIEALTTYDW